MVDEPSKTLSFHGLSRPEKLYDQHSMQIKISCANNLSQRFRAKSFVYVLSENASLGLALNKGSSPQNYPNSLMGAIALIRQTLYDAQWYQQAVESMRQDQRQASFAQNLSLQAWNDAVARQTPIIFETRNFENTLRAIGLSKEFDLPFILQTTGGEFRQLDKIKASGASFIIPLSYPEGYKIEDLADAPVKPRPNSPN